MKTCNTCKIEKEVSEFNKDKSRKDGLQLKCKSCQKKYSKKYRKNNKERIKEYKKEYDKANKEHLKQYYEANKERINEYTKEYHKANRDKINEVKRKYYLKNKKSIIKKNYEYQRNRMQTDPLYKMKRNLRTRTWAAFKNKGYSKDGRTQEMLGVDWEVAKAHIERQFTKGMNWDNYGEWHIDHIIPLASAKTPERLKKLCHYSNLQPLWAEDNLEKKDKINGQQNKLRL